MSRPAVVHIVGSLEGGGAERWVRELVPRLNARGMRSEIVSVYPPNLKEADLARIGCRVHYRAKRKGFDPIHFAWLCGVLANRRPDVVHTHQWAGKYVGRAAAILTRIPLIVHTEHSPIPMSYGERLLAAMLAPSTAGVIAFNEHKAQLIRAREYVKRFEIIRNGLPLRAVLTAEERAYAREKLAVDDRTVVFGVVASLQERKNPFLALRAFKAIATEAGSPTRLDFFGDGALRERLEREARELSIEDRVRFHGFRPDVRDMLPGLDVFLTVALQEMSPISMLEAMVAKLPMIGVPHPGTLEMIEHGVNGIVVAWDVEAVANAMRTLRDDRELRERLGGAGRAVVERDYDIERIADEHVALYERLMNRRIVRRASKALGRHEGTTNVETVISG